MTANTNQAEAWNGDDGRHWVGHADRYDRMQQDTTARLLAEAAIRPGESVLDLPLASLVKEAPLPVVRRRTRRSRSRRRRRCSGRSR